jgi:excisionase family DNA binding protein
MLKVSQVSQRLNLCISKVYELIQSNELSHHRIGGALRVSEQQLQEFLDSCKSEAPVRRAPRRRLKHVRI